MTDRLIIGTRDYQAVGDYSLEKFQEALKTQLGDVGQQQAWVTVPVADGDLTVFVTQDTEIGYLATRELRVPAPPDFPKI